MYFWKNFVFLFFLRSISNIFIMLAIVFLTWYPAYAEGFRAIPVMITGVQHLGHNFSISQFYINGYYGSNVGRGGGGGSFVCCIAIPEKWHPGLTAEIQWEVLDWSKEVRSEIDVQNYSSVIWEGTYSAMVPLEPYESAEGIYVHFFPNGKVRVVNSEYAPRSAHHPILRSDVDGGPLATAGKRIDEIITMKKKK